MPTCISRTAMGAGACQWLLGCSAKHHCWQRGCARREASGAYVCTHACQPVRGTRACQDGRPAGRPQLVQLQIVHPLPSGGRQRCVGSV